MLIFIAGPSGCGKSTAILKQETLGIKGLPPAKTFLVNPKGKPLPHRRWMERGFSEFHPNKSPQGNHLVSADLNIVTKSLNWCYKNKPDTFFYVLDDFQFLMTEHYLNKGASGSMVEFDDYQKIGFGTHALLNTATNMVGKFVFILTHSEFENQGDSAVGRGVHKIKTIGKMIDKYVSPEGRATITLFGKSKIDPVTNKVSKVFVTNYDGVYEKAKSPIDMFDLEIPNDLGLVAKKIRDYYGYIP